MTNPQLKSVRSPDDVFRAEKILERSVQMGEQTIGRATIQPGWRWSVDLKPSMGTESCTFRHLGIALSGRFHVLMDDGHEMDVAPDDVFDIPPGHDAWVVGVEPFETVEIAGIYGFGRLVAGENIRREHPDHRCRRFHGDARAARRTGMACASRALRAGAADS